MLWGFAEQQAHKYSADLSMWVRSGKDRQWERGEWVGGPIPDGYQRDGKTLAIDVKREPVIARLWELALDGRAPAPLARELNAAGLRTKATKKRPQARGLVAVCRTRSPTPSTRACSCATAAQSASSANRAGFPPTSRSSGSRRSRITRASVTSPPRAARRPDARRDASSSRRSHAARAAAAASTRSRRLTVARTARAAASTCAARSRKRPACATRQRCPPSSSTVTCADDRRARARRRRA
jgi:hypothetical protein